MSQLADRIAQLTPEKRALLIQKLKGGDGTAAQPAVQSKGNVVAKEWENFCYAVETPGNFDSIRFRETALVAPGPEQIQIKARAVSLNFRDLMIAMNMYPPTPGVPSNMGSDYAGIITACGEGVTTFKPGDEVIGLSAGTFTPEGQLLENVHFCAVPNISARQAVLKPKNISFEQAAAIPTVFLTSYYALQHVARMKAGEKVLIHTATGGVGQAAVQIAKWLGAEIFATAGSEEKREMLRSIGIEHVMDSRSTDFAAQIMETTGGKGVDVVLNTLSGEAMVKGMEILAPFGRFLQIDKNDIFRNTPLALAPFKNGLTFSAIDLSLFLMQPDLLKELLLEITGHLAEGHFNPIGFTGYNISELGAALTFLSRAKHTGKLVLTFD
jgi:NADPH:quinone reductase-like Zn-dependent oxidoreductase